jgi:phage shock protein A
MKKLIIIGLAVGALVAFVGTDVVGSAVSSARNGIREVLTSDIPLETRLAEAHAKIDAYAENIIDGEVAAASMKDMIAETERDVRSLEARVGHERKTLLALRTRLDGVASDGSQHLIPASLSEVPDSQARRDAMRYVESYRATSEMLARRHEDLGRLGDQYKATVAALDKARTERMRLSEEARVLKAEIESMNARKAAAQTRASVDNKSITSSGFAEADGSLKLIRNELRKQEKLLQYYELRQETDTARWTEDTYVPEAVDAGQAIEEVLAAYPGQE